MIFEYNKDFQKLPFLYDNSSFMRIMDIDERITHVFEYSKDLKTVLFIKIIIDN